MSNVEGAGPPCPDRVPLDHAERLLEVLSVSWRIFISQFVAGRYRFATEAPFQHHFANVIATVGSLYCTDRDDVFLVDLETRCEGVKGKSKFVDITCGFANVDTLCAVELKFKTRRQGAEDHGRIDMYVDIEALELLCCAKPYRFGKFFMIADNPYYAKPARRGVGTVFATHHGFRTTAGMRTRSTSKGREHVDINLQQPYEFLWTQQDAWAFLDMTVRPAGVATQGSSWVSVNPL
jgi:hypothetical protein